MAYLWVLFVILASLGQVVRNAMQRELTASLGTVGATQDASATNNPMGRVGQMQELKNLASFLMADGCDYLTGETIAIDGGNLLAGGSNFSQLSRLGDQDWENIRNMIKSANEKDKAKRTV